MIGNPYGQFLQNTQGNFSYGQPQQQNYGQNNSYQQNGYQQNQQVVAQPQVKSELIQVNGIDGAKAYQMQPSSSVALFDMTDNKFYIKASDMANFSTIKVFSYSELEEKNSNEEVAEYVLKNDFEELKSIVEQLVGGDKPKTSTRSKTTVENKTT